MAKVAKPKAREVSVHSRAARRGAEPAAKSASTKPAEKEQNDHWMYNTQNAGVTKKQKVKKLTHAQRVRQSKAIERGEKNSAVLERKVAESKQKARKVQNRAQDWDDLNGTVTPSDSQVVQTSNAEQDDTDVPVNGLEAGLQDIINEKELTQEQNEV